MIKVIAKPWKGGLGRYIYLALQDMFPGQVKWIPTRPSHISEWFLYKKSPDQWWKEVSNKIEHGSHDAALFIGFRNEWRNLRRDHRNILYAVDAIRMQSNDLSSFGHVFISDPGYEEDLLRILGRNEYGGVLPFAMYPPLHKPSNSIADKIDVCFIGNCDTKRDPYLRRLLQEKFRSLVVGNYFLKGPLFWRHPLSFRPSVANDDMGHIYSQSKVSLNIHADVVRSGTNMRTFECAGYGIPQVVEWRQGIDTLFCANEEILYFKDEDEMIEKIQRLLSRPSESKLMAQKAREHVLKEHTYYHRVARFLSHLISEDRLKNILSQTVSRYAAQ